MPETGPAENYPTTILSRADRNQRCQALLLLLGLWAGTAVAQTVLLDFNTTGQYTNNFNPWNDSTGTNGGVYSFMESPGAGAGGSGGVSVFQSSDTTAAYKARSWDFSTNGATVILSVLLKANGQTSGNKVQFGILNVNTNGLNANPGVAFESFRFIPTNATSWSLREQYRTGSAGAVETGLGSVTVVAGRWYKFVIALTNTSAATSNFNASCAIYDYGTDGQTPGTNAVTFATFQSHSGQQMARTAAVWPALRGFQNAGIDAWDNFLVYTTNSQPVFTVGLTNTSVAAGQMARFYALADGPGALGYSWYTNGTLVGGATSPAYTTPPVSISYSNVMVVASNSNGAATNSALLTVFTPPPATNMTPITVTGFNRDVVIESNAPGPPFTAALEFNPGENTAFYQNGLPGKTYGLPASGSFVSVLDNSTVFQFQPYTGSNALVLSTETGLTTGTLMLGTPATYSRIAIIAHSGNGGGTPNMTLHFNDATTLVLPYNAQDWFFNAGFALQGVDRINLTSGAAQGGPNDPRFYQTTVDLAALLGATNKPLSSISFDQAAGAGATAVYALSGLPVASVGLPNVVTVPASGLQATSATIGGQVTGTGGETPLVTLYYGTADGGTNPAAWAQTSALGLQGGAFSQTLSGLSPATAYYFAAKAQNSAGTVWATPTRTFTTSALALPIVTNLPASSILANRATLNGQVLSTGGDPPTITCYYGPADGGVNAAAWSNNVVVGVAAAAFSQPITGLSSNTAYFFTAKAVNGAGTAWAVPSQTFTTLATNPPGPALVAVLTYHNDNSRQGVTTNETMLTLSNVNSNSFGKMFSYTVDGYVYAQPLIMTNVTIPGMGMHNVVYVVTEHESVYAFDADSNDGPNASPLWQVSFLNAAAGVTSVPGGDVGTSDIVPEIGITATPVIDPATATLYLEAKTKEVTNSVTTYVHRLHALNLATGAERTNGPVVNSPVVIAATNYPGVGTGDNDGAGHVLWNPLKEHSRPALTLLNGVLYLAYASHGDNQPYHGWLFAYDARTLAQLSVYNSTPNGGLGGFWQGGGGATVDPAGNFYFITGNGSFDATGANFSQATNNFAMSVLKFSPTNGVLTVVDYFSPHDESGLSGGDQDFGSGAAIVLPDAVGSASHPHLLAAAGKGGRVYLLDRDNLGRFNSLNDNQIVQTVPNAMGGGQDGSYMTPVFWNSTLYYIGMNDRLKAFAISNAVISTTPVQSTTLFGDKGSSSPSLSANGSSNAIVWAMENDAYASSGPGILHAYNATNVAQELYNSSQLLARDNPGGSVKFVVPTVANGKVYVGAEYALSVYGVGAFLATPLIAPNGGIFTNSVTVALSDATPGTTLYYTLDGTAPTTNSVLYTSPFVLTNSAGVQVVAVKTGSVNSGIASAGFVNSASIGSGTGLLASYWSNTTSAAFGNPAFAVPPTLVRTDAMVNFNWGSGSPDPSISPDTFTARWTGMVQPQFSETYTFYTTTDDGVRLWVNGQLLIDQWVNESPTTWSATIALKAQQRYNLRMDYFENAGGAEAILAWSSPSTPQAVIPQTQLYPVTNPPPVVILAGPTNGSSFTATASVTVTANAAAQYNAVNEVDFYTNGAFLGSVSNNPYVLTATGLGAGSYTLTAVALDTTGLSGTSAPVNITVTPGTGLPYGLTSRASLAPFLNMPATFNGSLPATLSQTGVFTNTPSMYAASGLVPYNVTVPLWSDGALKTRWLAVPNSGAPYTPNEQIGFAPTGEWTFPTGTIFVKHFELATDLGNVNAPKRRLETRLLVRDPNGAVYGVTYKWRPDNSDADLLITNLSENIVITNADLTTWTQTWYYPSPSDCLVCHTPAANYVLGVKTRQLDTVFTYPSTGQSDNQLRTLNRLGLFYPAIDESSIAGYTHLVAVTNQSASLEDRARSYLDANCAQCHRPGGTGPTIDARWDTPLTNQNLIYGVLAKGNLGYDNAYVVVPDDIWRSILYQRTASLDSAVKMPPLARNLPDTNSLAVVAAWINSLSGIPALPPPAITPPGGTFNGPVVVTLQPPTNTATVYYTLDGTLPTTNSLFYTAPFTLTNTATVSANAFATGFNNSVAARGLFTLLPPVLFTSPGLFTNGAFRLQLVGTAGKSYVLQASTNFSNWVSLSTNAPGASPFYVLDPGASNFPYRFYRAFQQP